MNVRDTVRRAATSVVEQLEGRNYFSGAAASEAIAFDPELISRHPVAVSFDWHGSKVDAVKDEWLVYLPDENSEKRSVPSLRLMVFA